MASVVPFFLFVLCPVLVLFLLNFVKLFDLFLFRFPIFAPFLYLAFVVFCFLLFLLFFFIYSPVFCPLAMTSVPELVLTDPSQGDRKCSHPRATAGELVENRILLDEALAPLLQVERGDEADVVAQLEPGLPPAGVLATHNLHQNSPHHTMWRPPQKKKKIPKFILENIPDALFLKKFLIFQLWSSKDIERF
jgi:hypothetical protein